jgi:hypothetical protein
MDTPTYIPILRAVPKFDRDASPQPGQELPEVTVRALAYLFARMDLLTPDVLQMAVPFLQTLSAKDYWLICDCQGQTLKPPVMYPQRVPGARERTMTLVPLYSRGAHAEKCPFERARREEGESTWSVRRRAPKGLGVLTAFKASRHASRPSRGLQKGQSKSKRLPSLAGVLFKVLEEAGLHWVDATKRSVTTDKEKLRQALDTMSLDGNGAIAARTFVRLSFHDFAKLETELLALGARSWPSKLHPHGLIIEQLEDVDIRPDRSKWLIPTYGSPLEVSGRLYLPGAGTLGPYLAIALVAIMPGETQAAIHRAYVHPIYSFDEWLLVDSDLERKTLSILMAKLQFQAMRAKNPYEIEKPLLDIAPDPSAPDERVRPDFVVISQGKKLVVETMGYADPQYIDRKQRTHAQMEKIGKVIKHEAGHDAELRSKVLDFVSKR